MWILNVCLFDVCANEQLSIATFSTLLAGTLYATMGKKPSTTPPINAGSSEEEKFIL
jgi:hypothetical protein